MNENISILYPESKENENYKKMSDITWHDLGMDQICKNVVRNDRERNIVQNVMMNLTDHEDVSKYRMDVFDDIYSNPILRDNVIKLLNQIYEIQDYMSLKRSIDKVDSLWTLMKRLKEIYEYILCIEKLEEALSDSNIRSSGLLNLRKYVSNIQNDCAFKELKRDIESLHLETKKVKSVTIGVNVNEFYEATSMGIVSLNDKAFSQANILSSFHHHFSKQDQVQNGNEWNNNYTYQTVPEKNNQAFQILTKTSEVFTSALNPLMGVGIGLASINNNQPEVHLLDYLDQVANNMMSRSVKQLKETLSKYATVNIYTITSLIPEFEYYILWARYLEKMKEKGYAFSKASVSSYSMDAKNIYNLKLLENTKDVVGNDLRFDNEHCVYILTGANRGGKTTITQAIGQLFVLAQGGIYIPGGEFMFSPVDMICTHFPADEDKTLNYGRLGEECNRYKEIYKSVTSHSLVLLNESFSTTSFEEGYYIAKDAIRSLLNKGVRTIYNTHMHKLAKDIDDFNDEFDVYKASSLIVKNRSFKVEIAPTEENSMAKSIAEKYGVTYEQLVNN